MHRNSQKRIYQSNKAIFITSNTKNWEPFLNEHILCDQFEIDLAKTAKLKEFKNIAYKINPDHIHLLIYPQGEFNYSQYMQTLKSNFTRNANRILGFDEVFNAQYFEYEKGGNSPVETIPINKFAKEILPIRRKFLEKNGSKLSDSRFEWHHSFHDHYIRNRFDFDNHILYIENQWIKHNYAENKYCFVDYDTVASFGYCW